MKNKENKIMSNNNHSIARRLAAVLATVAALLASVGLAFTANAATTGTIVVNEVEDNATIHAYRIIDSVIDSQTGEVIEPQWTWNDAVATWLTENEYTTFVDTENQNAVTDEFASLTGSDADSFYDELAAALRGSLSSVPTIDPDTQSNNIATFEAAPFGQYLIVVENGLKVYQPSTVTLKPSDTEPVEINVKSTPISIEKQVKEGAYDQGTFDGDVSTAGTIGNTVSFQLSADVPGFLDNAVHKTFWLSDTPSAGLQVTGDIVVTGVDNGGTSHLLTDSTHYNQSFTDGTYRWDFVYSEIKDLKTVTIKYNTNIQPTGLVTGTEGNVNTATVTYSNNPYDPASADTTQSASSTATVYSYGIEVTKTDANDGTALQGAKFKVARDSEGTYVVLDEATTDENGKISFKGLGTGTWYLIETQAAPGYLRSSSPTTTVTITDPEPDGQPVGGTADGFVEVGVDNSKAFDLAQTGAAGIAVMVLLGLLLVGGGVTMAVKQRR